MTKHTQPYIYNRKHLTYINVFTRYRKKKRQKNQKIIKTFLKEKQTNKQEEEEAPTLNIIIIYINAYMY